MNSPDTLNSISSPESEDGVSLYASPAGPTLDLSGQALALASHSAKPERAQARATPATSGPSSATSSRSESLQSRLASRLQARLDVNGSLEYVLTWKDWDMESGPPICALRASARRTSAKDCSGWPTPDTNQRGGAQDPEKRKAGGHSVNLQDAALLAGWPTPRSEDSQSSGERISRGVCDTPTSVSRLACWATPTVQDSANNAGPSQFRRNSLPLNCEATLGVASTSCPAQTEKRGALNPDHSRWLMGYPAEWGSCGATAMQSCRRSPRNSSKHS